MFRFHSTLEHLMLNQYISQQAKIMVFSHLGNTQIYTVLQFLARCNLTEIRKVVLKIVANVKISVHHFSVQLHMQIHFIFKTEFFLPSEVLLAFFYFLHQIYQEL